MRQVGRKGRRAFRQLAGRTPSCPAPMATRGTRTFAGGGSCGTGPHGPRGPRGFVWHGSPWAAGGVGQWGARSGAGRAGNKRACLIFSWRGARLAVVADSQAVGAGTVGAGDTRGGGTVGGMEGV